MFIGLSITHLLSIDDFIIVGGGSVLEWKHLQTLLLQYYIASGLDVSNSKSYLLYSCKEQSPIDSLLSLFPFKSGICEEGVKYLGFLLKPNGYNPKDWEWLLNIITRKITGRSC